MRRYILDTLVVLSLIEGKGSVLNKVQSISPQHLYISAAQCGELFMLINDAYNKKVFEGVIANLNVLDFDIEAARAFATLKNKLKAQGDFPSDIELQTAAIAIAKKCVYVTPNEEFKELEGLEVENWISED